MYVGNVVLVQLVVATCHVTGYEWSITYNGERQDNIHLNKYYVKKPCNEDTSICVPITYSSVYCQLLNIADRDSQFQQILNNKTCGFVHKEPMVCSPIDEVSDKPYCNIDDLSKDDQINKANILKRIIEQTEVICGKRTLNLDTDRIEGGKDASPGDWPWMVLLGYRSGSSSKPSYECGGTLITRKSVLTSAHCIYQREVTEVLLGDTNLNTSHDCLDPSFYPSCVCATAECPFSTHAQCVASGQCSDRRVVRRISNTSVHPLYSNTTWEYDVGIITLEDPVRISDYIIPVCLAHSQGQLEGDRLWFVTGWGATAEKREISTILQQVQVDITSRKSCGEQWNIAVPPSQVCATGSQDGSSICEGDSGGPLITRRDGVWEQAAIVSSGSSVCGGSKPSFFTLINRNVLDWVAANVDSKLPNSP